MANTLPIRAATADAAPAAGLPLLVGHADAARLCGISRASWHRAMAAGRIGPEPVRLGGRVLFQRRELEEWVAAGCPGRREWRATRAASGRASR